MPKRTALYESHALLGAKFTEFGGWEMPLNYPLGQIKEHMAARESSAVFDVSHMGRLKISGNGALPLLQKATTSNVAGLEVGKAMYTILANEAGGLIDDCYLYRFEEGYYILVVNAANHDKALEALNRVNETCFAIIEDISDEMAMLSVQGPHSRSAVFSLSESLSIEPLKNSLGKAMVMGEEVLLSRTGYTGEPVGFEIFCRSSFVKTLWDQLIKKGAQPVGLAARDTLRLEAGMPLYGMEYGTAPDGKEIPAFAFSLAMKAVSFSAIKGAYIGREALYRQYKAYERIESGDFSDISDLPRLIVPFVALNPPVPRHGDPVMLEDRQVGFITSSTIAPYRETEGEGLESAFTGEVKKRFIGFAIIGSEESKKEGLIAIARGKEAPIFVVESHLRSDAPPRSRPIAYGHKAEGGAKRQGEYLGLAEKLITESIENHEFRQNEAINLIPSEMTMSKAVRLLSGLDPSFRYAEHRKLKSYYSKDIFYYQGTGFIGMVEELLNEELKKYLGAKQVESRALSGQMANTIAFSALMSYKNRNRPRMEPRRLGYIMNNRLSNGGHLSAQPMGALKDFVAYDSNTDRRALVNIPVEAGNPYKADVEKLKELIVDYHPELIIFGKSMIIETEPIKEISEFIAKEGTQTVVMYDMAHVLGLLGPLFQEPFKEGADIVTASTHKTFFGTQRGIVAGSFEEGDPFWEEVENRAFPGATSNHHLGTMLGLLMASYEMNAFKAEYQEAVLTNAKAFATALAENGFKVEGDPYMGYTKTHQAIIRVGYAKGIEIARRLEENGIITNFQQAPDEEGFSAAGAIRLGVAEMTRFGFGPDEFKKTASLMADCALKGSKIKSEVALLRGKFTDLHYAFDDKISENLMEKLLGGYRL